MKTLVPYAVMLLLVAEFIDEETAGRVTDACLARRPFVRQTQGNMIRLFPALNIRAEELKEGLTILESAIGVSESAKRAGG